MATVSIDIVEGSEVQQDANGYYHRRVAIVSGLSGTASVKIYNALIDPGIPQLYELHPTIAFIQCYRRRGRALDSGIVEVDCEYQLIPADDAAVAGGEVTLEVGTTLQATTTERDHQGNQIFTTHTTNIGVSAAGDRVVFDPKHNINDWTSIETRKEHQVGQVAYFKPMTVLRYSRLEAGNPRVKSRSYVGTINKTPLFGDPKHYWLCSRLSGQRQVSGLYRVNYEFQRNIDGWDALIIHTQEDGKFIQEPVSGDSLRVFQVYPDRDFTRLGLTLPRSSAGSGTLGGFDSINIPPIGSI